MPLLLRLIYLAGVLLPALSLAQSPVGVQTLADTLVDLERRAPADVRALNDAVLAAEVAAVVQRVAADVGQAVGAGELLLQLDPTDHELNLRQLEARLASSHAQKAEADAKLERARELGAQQYVSADELLERETRAMVLAAQIQADEVALAVARRALEKCRITAPFDGVVAERQAQVGAYVTVGSPLLRLTQMDGFELDAEIPADQAASLERAEALFFLSRGERFPVTLLRLSPAIEIQRRSRRARLSFAADAPEVGRSGELVWRIGGGLLPSNLVSRRDGRLGVFVYRDGRARFEALPGAQEGRPVAVDLPADTEIIVLGAERLQDGEAVDVRR